MCSSSSGTLTPTYVCTEEGESGTDRNGLGGKHPGCSSERHRCSRLERDPLLLERSLMNRGFKTDSLAGEKGRHKQQQVAIAERDRSHNVSQTEIKGCGGKKHILWDSFWGRWHKMTLSFFLPFDVGC